MLDEVLTRSVEAGVTRWVTVATGPGEIEENVGLAENRDGVYAAVGYHPHNAKAVTKADMNVLAEAVKLEKVVAVGETGLDFHYNFSKQELQKDLFRGILDIAAAAGKPVIVHTRNAFDETFEILNEYAGQLTGAVVHCFSGSIEQAKAVLEKGWLVSFTGIITFKNGESVREAARAVPVERMMVETDCPYISPTPVRNVKPCEPAMVVHTAKKLAEIKGMGLEDFAESVTTTSKRFFGIE
jgi:TatD DNase family protein